jgi:hypothetical protein
MGIPLGYEYTTVICLGVEQHNVNVEKYFGIENKFE